MDGFLIVNKPSAMTSYDVIRSLKRLLPRKTKIGHLGTLDPMVTGVLPIAIGQATKIIPYIEDESKEYVATLTLGGVSDTQDVWGNVTYKNSVQIEAEPIETALKNLVGDIEQIPPMYSAVHHQGQKLYELARKGVIVERKARPARIFAIDVLQIDLKGQFPLIQFRVVCSKGTYIRTLCNDIGEKLGTGGFLSSLIRTKSGIFTLDDSHSLAEILAEPEDIKGLLAVDFPLKHWPVYRLKDRAESLAISNGNPIYTTSELPLGFMRIYDQEEQFVAIGQANAENLSVAIKPIRVFKTV